MDVGGRYVPKPRARTNQWEWEEQQEKPGGGGRCGHRRRVCWSSSAHITAFSMNGSPLMLR